MNMPFVFLKTAIACMEKSVITISHKKLEYFFMWEQAFKNHNLFRRAMLRFISYAFLQCIVYVWG